MTRYLSVVGVLLFSVAASAAPITIDFDGDTQSGVVILTQGFSFSSDLSSEIIGAGGPSGVAAYCPGCSVTMTNLAGGPFSLLSFDYLNPGFPQIGDTSFTVTGNYAGGGQTSVLIDAPLVGAGGSAYSIATLGAGWENLSSVVFGPSGNGTALVLDNIVVDVVPIPAAVWLFGTALMALGWFKRAA